MINVRLKIKTAMIKINNKKETIKQLAFDITQKEISWLFLENSYALES